MTAPRFVVLEGIDGSGTTTQLTRVAARLRERGHSVHETREPSRGPIGAMARGLLSSEAVDPRTLALLFAGDRLDHLEREIEPALARGEVVLCDRYVVSSWVYQSIDCPGADAATWIRSLNAHARWPDATFVFDLDAELALARVAARRAATGEPVERFDRAAVQVRLAKGYAAVLAESPGPGLFRVDAAATIEAVTDSIVASLVAAGL